MTVDLEKKLLPPPELVTDGSASLSSYIGVGAHFKALLEQYLPLRPDMRVLEMGSAIGRIARQFVNILSPQGSYTGIEIMPAQVAWCIEHIAGPFPWFRFIHADIYNSEYNPGGRIKAENYCFPCKDGELDLALFTSVFTHMLRRDLARYLHEVQRTLKPGAFCFATFFTYTPEELKRVATQDARPPFPFPVFRQGGLPVVMCADPQCLEEAVAYEKNYLEALFAESALATEIFLPGTWLQREQPGHSYQDIYILRKQAAAPGGIRPPL